MYIIDYNIAALFILAIIFVLLVSVRKGIVRQSRSGRLFLIILVASFVTILADLFSTYTIYNVERFGVDFSKIITAIYFSISNITYLLYFYYVLILDKKKNYFLKTFIFISMAVIVVACCLNFEHEFIFSFNDSKEYVRGIGTYIFDLVGIIYSVFMILYIIYRGKYLKRRNVIPVFCYILLSIIAITIQALFKKYLVLGFSNSLALLIIFMSLENPHSYLDTDSNAFNTKTFYDDIDTFIKKKKKFIVISLYFEELKFLVDSLGYETYMKVQREITSYLSKNYSKQVYYLSDSQYVLVLDKVPTTLRKLQNEGIELEKQEINLKPSIISFNYPKNVKRKEEIIQLVSFVKDKKNIDTQDALKKLSRTIEVESYIRDAIKNRSFEVFFQPIYSIKDRAYKSAEVLVRMPNNVCYPDEFIPLAEKLGLISKVDEIILDKALSIISKNKLNEKLRKIEINLSPVECLNKDLSKRIIKCADKNKINHNFINLEITETSEILENDIFKKNIKELKEKGISFSLDDFGTGYSNITNMINYPFSIVKIDKSLLYQAFESNKSRKLLESLVNLIFTLGYDIIVEGVETEEQLNFLRRLNVNNIQGYYFSKPVDENTFVNMINRN